MKKIILTIAAVLALALGGTTAVSATQPPDHKVGLCHRTASDTNPYVFIRVDVASLPAHLNDLPGHPAKEWKSNGTFRGVAHVKGDLKRDYIANEASECNDFATPSPSASVTPSEEPSASPSASPSVEPTPSVKPSATPSASPTNSPSASPSATPSTGSSETPASTPSSPSMTPPATDVQAAAGQSAQPDRSGFIFLFIAITLISAVYVKVALGRGNYE